MDNVIKELEEAGYDYTVAIATIGELNANAACGQLSLILEKEEYINDRIKSSK